MWAKINKNNVVESCVIDITKEISNENGSYFVKMTPENSPAFIGAYWNGKMFVKVGE